MPTVRTPRPLTRRALLAATAGLAVGAAATLGAACPGLAGGSVTLIVPYSAGGGFDVYARLVEPFLERRLAAEIAVHNVTGAGGLVGSKTVRDAAPDGRTIGIVNGGGLLMARLVEGDQVPDLAGDYTILGRLARQAYVWVTSPRSGVAGIADLLAPGRRPAVFGITDVGGGDFVSAVLGSHALSMPVAFVPGYRGSQDSALGLMRGEIDVSSGSFESLLDGIEAGDLRPVLQLADKPLATHPALAGVPTLVALARQRATAAGRPVEATVDDARAIAGITDAGRLIVAPRGLEPGLAACFEEALSAAAANPGFVDAAAKARRSLDVLGGTAAAENLREISARSSSFAPVIAESVRLVRS
jgi:tripartite-type tricarboxylate transporter receptor subunit TctC